MAASSVGRIVVASLTGGLLLAVGLVMGPMAGAEEHVVTGTFLLTSAASWATLAILSVSMTTKPQRWAAMPAVFMATAGGSLLLFAPSGSMLGSLGWIWPPLLLVVLAVAAARASRDLRDRTGRWVVFPLMAVYALAAVGGACQTIAEHVDSRASHPPGQLVDVGGHRLHLLCVGSGAPTVILESGLGEASGYWGWVATAAARETRVCTYDRAGRGWSEPPAVPQDGVAVATDLHRLLQRADVVGPFVLVGHSSGAAYVRIFTGRYPEQVAGMVLLDGQPAEAFERLPDFPRFYDVSRRFVSLLPSLARLGAGRLLSASSFSSLPANARDMQRFTYSSTWSARSLRDEFTELPTVLAQARSFQSIGDRPLIVVTATQHAQAGWLPMQDAMAKLSTNSSHRSVPFTHDALVTERIAAQASIAAIRDVVQAVRQSRHLDS